MKIERVDSEIQKELNKILSGGEFRDPRLDGVMVSVMHVETTRDLKYAKVVVSIMGGDGKELIKVLQSGAGFMKNELFRRLRVRAVPDITFILDESVEYAIKIDKILKEINGDK